MLGISIGMSTTTLRTGGGWVPHVPFNPPTNLVDGSTSTGWSAVSPGTISTSMYPVPHPSEQSSGLKISLAAGQTFGGARKTTGIPPIVMSDVALVGMWVYWTGGQQGSIELRLSSDAFSAKRRAFSWSYSGQLHSGWNLITIRPDDDGSTSPARLPWTVIGMQALTETINGLQVNISSNGTGTRDAYVGPIFYHQNVPTKGAIMLGFSSFGEATVVNDALPILRAANIKAYWAGDGDVAEGATASGYLDTVYAAGWDVIQQGRHHTNYVLDPSNLSSDFDQTKAFFQSRGWTRAINHFIWPFSTSDAVTEAIISGKGVVEAKGLGNWWIHPNEYNAGPKLVGHGGIDLCSPILTLAQAKKFVDSAVTYGVTIQMFCHGLTTGASNSLDWNKADYQELVDYIVAYRNAGVLDCDPPSVWYRKRKV